MTETAAHFTGIACGNRQVPPTSMPSAIAGHGPNVVAVCAADPLEINAVLFSTGAKRCLIVSFDLLYIGGSLERTLRSALRARFALTESDVVLFASHTHFAPPTDAALPALGLCDAAYAARLTDATLDLVAELVRTPPTRVRIEIRKGHLAHSVNRRRPRIAPTYTRTSGLAFDRVTFAPYEQGLRDDTATVITFVSAAAGEPIAAVWNYACHPVGHMPSNVTSADFPGAARAALRKTYGRGLPVLFLQGFCADVRPNLPAAKSPTLTRALRDLVRTAISGSPRMAPTEEAWLTWVATLQEQIVRIATSTPECMDEIADFATATIAVPAAQFFDGSVRTESLVVRGLRLGKIVEILALGAEASVGWQHELNAVLAEPSGVRIYAGYCGDVFGYLPLPKQLREGGYEVIGSQQLLGLRGTFRESELLGSLVDAVGTVARAVRPS